MQQEAMSSAENLQKSYKTMMEKYSRLEQEHDATLKIIEDLNQQNNMKDQAVNNAH